MITIYTKTPCPYCIKAKSLLDSLNVQYEETDITNSPEAFAELSNRSRMMTVPQIFFGDLLIGWYDQIASLYESGELQDLLLQSGEQAALSK